MITIEEIKKEFDKQFKDTIFTKTGLERRGGWKDSLQYKIIVADNLESFTLQIIKGEVNGWKEIRDILEDVSDLYYEYFENFIGDDLYHEWSFRDNTFIFDLLFYDMKNNNLIKVKPIISERIEEKKEDNRLYKLQKAEKKKETFQKGIYQHYKGKRYLVIGLAKNNENLEELVIYQALYDNYDFWVRSKEDFLAEIMVEGQKVKRFTFIK